MLDPLFKPGENLTMPQFGHKADNSFPMKGLVVEYNGKMLHVCGFHSTRPVGSITKGRVVANVIELPDGIGGLCDNSYAVELSEPIMIDPFFSVGTMLDDNLLNTFRANGSCAVMHGKMFHYLKKLSQRYHPSTMQRSSERAYVDTKFSLSMKDWYPMQKYNVKKTLKEEFRSFPKGTNIMVLENIGDDEFSAIFPDGDRRLVPLSLLGNFTLNTPTVSSKNLEQSSFKFKDGGLAQS